MPAAFAAKLAASAVLRNRLVEEYGEMDLERIYAGLQAAVHDVPEYLLLFAEHLKKPVPK